MLAIGLPKRVWFVATAALLGCLGPTNAHAQGGATQPPGAKQGAAPKAAAKPQYAEIFIEDHPEWKGLRSKFVEKGAPENDDELKVFTGHYNWVVSFLTHYSNNPKSFNIAEHGDKIADARIKLRGEVVMWSKGKPSTAFHDALVEQLAKLLPNLFNNEKYHPVTRVNALWLYGDLNSKEGDAGLVPLATAFPVLLKIFTTDTQPAYLRAAALGGLARHAEAGPTPEARKELTAEMLKLLKAQPPGIKPEVYDFFRLRAVEALRNLAMKGSDASAKQVAGALWGLLQNKDGKTPLDLRCEALRAMGALEGKVIPESIFREVAQTSAKLALEIARQTPKPDDLETDEEATGVAVNGPAQTPLAANQFAAVNVQDPDAANPAGNADQAAPNPAAPIPGAAPNAAAAPAAPKQVGGLPPDIQAYFLGCVYTGLSVADGKRGVAASANDAESKKLVAEISGRVGDMLKVVKLKKHGDKLSDVEYKKVQSSIDQLQKLSGGAAPAAE